MKSDFIILLTALVAVGCSSDYAPPAGASGEAIFQVACEECHHTNSDGSIFHLKADKANIKYIKQHVATGSLLMPAFPKMQEDDLLKVSAYALDHNKAPRE